MSNRFFSITNPPPCNMEDYSNCEVLVDPSHDEPIQVIVKKLLSGTISPQRSSVVFDTEDITKVKDVNSFMTANEPLRAGYSDFSDVQVYAELAKGTIERLKRGSQAQSRVEPVTPPDSQKSESKESQSRSNADLNGTGTQAE